MSFSVEYGDILDFEADAVVMPANPKPVVGNGLEKLIYDKAGRNHLLNARNEIGELGFGEAAISDAYDLRNIGYRYIIHVVSPEYDGEEGDSDKLLRECYENALQLAYDNKCNNVVFPLLSTGVLKYPEERAQNIAEGVCKLFCADHDVDIILVKYDGSKPISDSDREELSRYIEENSYSQINQEQYERAEREWSDLPAEREEHSLLELMRKQIARKKADEKAYKEFLQKEEARRKKASKDKVSTNTAFKMCYMRFLSSDQFATEKEIPTFNEVFEKFRTKHNAGNYADICRKANLRQDTLSKLRKEKVHPTRDYLWALAFALGVDLEETEELFNSCGLSTYGRYGLQDAEKEREVFFKFGIEKKWNIKQLNQVLKDEKLLTLGNRIVA